MDPSCFPGFGKAAGPNGEVRIGIIGMGGLDTPGNVGGRGRQLIGFLSEVPEARIVALCDVDEKLLQHEAEQLKKRGLSAATYRDIRQMLDDKSIDAVMVATPNHWHALAGIWACQAGKHAYVEKPMSYNIWEGRQVVAAAGKYGCIVEAGMEGRSADALRQAFDFLRGGSLGPIRHAHVVLHRERKSIGKVTASTPVPPTIDYNLWCGPAPISPLNRKYLHYDWHSIWNNGNGEMGNNGVHYLDMCRMALNLNRPPRRAMSLGGRFGYVDDGQTPNTQLAIFDFDPTIVTCEIQGLPQHGSGTFRTVSMGCIVQCEGGFFAGTFSGGAVYDNQEKKIKEFKGVNMQKLQVQHVANFVHAVQSQNADDLRANALEGHLSAACCHMANVSYRLGTQSTPEAILERTRPNHELTDAFQRCREHLRANGVDIENTPETLGPWVELDPEKERFVGEYSEGANALATRTYREPFAVPSLA